LACADSRLRRLPGSLAGLPGISLDPSEVDDVI